MLISTIKFFKDKIARARRENTICSLWKIKKGLLQQIARETWYYLLMTYTEKHHRKSRQTRVICNLHSCYNFALVLNAKSIVFSQSEARNFFMYIMMTVIFSSPSRGHRCQPFNSQDLISNSFYCLPYSSCDINLENLVLNQLIIPWLIFFFILITCLLDIVLIL